MFRWSLKWQLFTAILGVLLPTLLLYNWIVGNVLLNALDRELASHLSMVSNLAKTYLPLASMTGYLANDETTATYQKDVARLVDFSRSNHLDRVSILTNQGVIRIDSGDWTPGTATGLSDQLLQNPEGALTRLHRNPNGQWRKIIITRLDQDHLMRLSAGSDMFAVIDRVRFRRSVILAMGIVLALGLSFGMAMGMGKRVSRLSKAFLAMQTGQPDIQVPVHGHDELAFLSRSFNDMAREIARQTQLERSHHEARISELKVLSAGIAHEIRNPLGAISGLAELLARQPHLNESHDTRDLVARILKEIERVNGIVTDVMSYARQPAIQIMPIPARDVITMVRELDSGSEVLCDPAVQTIHADQAGLFTILRNLILNARQAAGPDGKVSVQLFMQNGQWVISVRDSGPGIASDEAGKIFQPFYTNKINGTGLGLAISRNIAEAHNGSLSYSSQPSGAVFSLSLPFVKES